MTKKFLERELHRLLLQQFRDRILERSASDAKSNYDRERNC